MKHIFLFIVIIIFLASCEKAEQRKFAGWGKKWNISFEYNGQDSMPAFEFESTAKFNKRNSTITIGDTLTMYYIYYPEENVLVFADTIQILIYNKKAWVARKFSGYFDEDFEKIGGWWKYYYNGDSLYNSSKPYNYDSFTWELNFWYLNKI